MDPAWREEEFDRRLVSEYLKYGSVDEVFRRNRYDLPISVAGFHRLLDRWGVVKAAGPNNKLSEVIDFLEQLALEKIPLERLYKRLPPSFQTSVATMHRVLSYVKRGMTRRVATALVITPEGSGKQVLIGRDVSSPRIEYGKYYGALSLPMGFSKRKESFEKSVLRVLQQEVFTKQTVERSFPFEVIPSKLEPIVYFDVADIRLNVFHLVLPKKHGDLGNFESFKLKEYQYVSPQEAKQMRSEFRVGVVEIVEIYERYLGAKPEVVTSELNRELVLEISERPVRP